MMDSEIGLNKGTRTNSTQRFEDFASELPGRGEIERWCRSTKSYMTNDQKAVLQGRTPAKLALDTHRAVRLHGAAGASGIGERLP